MHLGQVDSIVPSEWGLFPSESPVMDLHPSSKFIAFNTRKQQAVLYNRKLRKCTPLEEGIEFEPKRAIKFTNDLLLVAEKGHHAIKAYSLLTGKLKKKITAHRTPVNCIAYCSQRTLFATLSHENCMIFNERTLQRQKLMECATSSFAQGVFAPSGQYLATSFLDGTVAAWNLDDYSQRQAGLSGGKVALACSDDGVLAAYSPKEIAVADLAKPTLMFSDLEPFWDAPIRNVEFLGAILVVVTTSSAYLAELSKNPTIVVSRIHLVSDPLDHVVAQTHTGELLALTQKQFRIVRVYQQHENKIMEIGNPLTNEGLVCCGGYANSTGCPMAVTKGSTYDYDRNTHLQEPIIKAVYKPVTYTEFSVPELQAFVIKHHIFPDKYRPAAYRYLLKLPISLDHFKEYERKGVHACTEMLDAKYPIQSPALAGTLKKVLGVLAHHNPLYAECETLPIMAFPFVCLLGSDEMLCFQVLYRLLTHWLGSMFVQFPMPNAPLLQGLRGDLLEADRELVTHLDHYKIPFTKLYWSLYSTLMTNVLPREAFLAMVDAIFAHSDEPSRLLYMCLGFISYNRTILLTLRSEQDLDRFLDSEHTIHTAKFMKIAHQLYDKFNNKHSKAALPTLTSYEPNLNYPLDAVKMHSTRRLLQTEELRNALQETHYQTSFHKHVENMAATAKELAEIEKIRQQSYAFYVEKQTKSAKNVQIPNYNRSVRINKLNKLIEEVTKLIEITKDGEQTIGNHFPTLPNNIEQQPDSELDHIELALAELLTKMKHMKDHRPQTAQPIPPQKQTVSNHSGLQKAMTAKMGTQLWGNTAQSTSNEQLRWQNDLIKAAR